MRTGRIIIPYSALLLPKILSPTKFKLLSGLIYELVVNSITLDIDECLSETTNNCSISRNQLCVNTEGGFVCECETGFRTLDGGATCQGSLAFSHAILLYNIAGSGYVADNM